MSAGRERQKFYTSIASLSNTTKYPLIVIDIVLQTDPDITAHRQGGQGNLICTPAQFQRYSRYSSQAGG